MLLDDVGLREAVSSALIEFQQRTSIPVAATIDLDGAITEDELNIITVGINYYINGYATRATLDVMFILDPVASSVADELGNLGILGDDDNQDGQIILRAQLQLLF